MKGRVPGPRQAATHRSGRDMAAIYPDLEGQTVIVTGGAGGNTSGGWDLAANKIV